MSQAPKATKTYVPPRDKSLDDVQVLGEWNFTLQGNTPLYWIKTGTLERYLCKFILRSPGNSTYGFLIHAAADGDGTDGVSFWVERRPGKRGSKEGTRRYICAGDGLESKPIVTRPFSDLGGEMVEDFEVMVQGYNGVIMINNRSLHIRFKAKTNRGCLAFYNSTQSEEEDDVHFSEVRITALRRGPMEIGGVLGRRERALVAAPEREKRMPISASEAASHTTAVAQDCPPDGVEEGALRLSQAHESTKSSAAKFGSADTTHLPDSATVGFSTQASGFRSTAPPSQFQQRGANGAARHADGGGSSSPDKIWGASYTLGGTRNGGTRAGGGVLRKSASESVLRKTTGGLDGYSSEGQRPRKGGNDQWMPILRNAPKSEQKFLKEYYRQKPAKGAACSDFIPMDQKTNICPG